MNLLVANPVLISENSTVDGVDNSKVVGAKIDVKIAKSKSKNLVKSFLANFQAST